MENTNFTRKQIVEVIKIAKDIDNTDCPLISMDTSSFHLLINSIKILIDCHDIENYSICHIWYLDKYNIENNELNTKFECFENINDLINRLKQILKEMIK